MSQNYEKIKTNKKEDTNSKKLGVMALTAVVLSAMVGGGIYDLPQNMAVNAGAIGQIFSWIITGIIMWFIVKSFMILTDIYPEYKTGLYQYVEKGFGGYAGFFTSWGYWICECFANVTYSVLLMATLDFFFPGKFTGGNNIWSIIGGSIILWLMSLLILNGVKAASSVEIAGTIGMLITTAIFLVVMAISFNWGNFTTNMFANHAIPHLNDKDLGSLQHQISATMMTTLWVFGGVEGAVVLSEKAKSQKDVKTATHLGFIICLVLYALASLLPLGLKSYGEIAAMKSPSSGVLLSLIIGPTGRVIIAVGVIVAILASWLTWTLMLSEMPYAAAKAKHFPKQFARTNKNDIPYVSLITSSIIMELIIILTHFSTQAFNTMLTIVGTMTVPPYLLSILFLVKSSYKQNNWPGHHHYKRKNTLIISIIALIGILYMGISAGIKYTVISFIIYAIGIPFYIYARHQFEPNEKTFTKIEAIFATGIILIAIVGVFIILI
ncbi:amino acid permease [Staphylococcus taiwanensis]|nr:amino acid permease [Staphylococcus taiwanensis]